MEEDGFHVTENTHFVYDKKKIQFCDSYLARNSMENHLLLSTFFQLQNDTPIDIYLTSAKKKFVWKGNDISLCLFYIEYGTTASSTVFIPFYLFMCV